MFRWILRIFLVGVLFAGALLLSRNWLGERALRNALEQATGLPCTVGAFEFPLTAPSIEAHAVAINNLPYAFHTPMAVGIRALSARYDPWSLLHGKLFLSKLDCDVAVLNCVRNPEGATNLKGLCDRLLSVRNPSPPLQVEELVIHIESVRYVDESHGLPQKQERSHREKHVYRDLRGTAAVLKAVADTLAGVQAADPFSPSTPAPRARKASTVKSGR